MITNKESIKRNWLHFKSNNDSGFIDLNKIFYLKKIEDASDSMIILRSLDCEKYIQIDGKRSYIQGLYLEIKNRLGLE